MQHRVEWANPEKTVILQVFTGKWSSHDQRAISEQTFSMSTSVPHTVHVIIDSRNADGFPKVIISEIGPLLEKWVPPNQGLLISVGANQFMRSLSGLSRLIAPRATQNLHFVRTMEQAWELLFKEAGISPPPA